MWIGGDSFCAPSNHRANLISPKSPSLLVLVPEGVVFPPAGQSEYEYRYTEYKYKYKYEGEEMRSTYSYSYSSRSRS